METSVPANDLEFEGDAGGGRTRLAKLHWPLVLMKFAVSTLFIIIVVRKVAFADLLTQIDRVRLWPLVAGLGLLLTQFPLAGCRWRMVLRACGADASLWLLQNLVWVGQFVNQVDLLPLNALVFG